MRHVLVVGETGPLLRPMPWMKHGVQQAMYHL